MPTLGFLKKKRTRESPGQKDLASPTSTSSQATSPITPTSSRGFTDSIASVSTQSTAPQIPSSSQPSAPAQEEVPTTVGAQQPMTQGVSYQQQASAPGQYQDIKPAANIDHQNLPTINNLINPPQTDGATQSKAEQLPSDASNGQAQQPGPQHLKLAQAMPQTTPVRQTKGKYSLRDFEILRTLGTGSFGRVHLVQSKHNSRFYAVKVLKKAQVVKMKQVEHTNDERRMLQEVKHPFLVTLWGTFQDSKNLYMVMDFVEGGELFSLLRKSQVSASSTWHVENPISNDLTEIP
jgi:protein kinase A